MRGSIRLVTLRGLPVRVHYTFLLVLPFLAWSFAGAFRGAALAAQVPPERLVGPPLAWGLGLALALFLSVLVHELAHSLYALWHGGQVADITLMMIGGVSRVTRMPERSRHEALMALAGPVTSLVLGGLCLLGARLLGEAGSFNLRFAFFYLGSLNVFLGCFNLLPAFPMDGGRVLRALLAGRLGPVRATRVAGRVGQCFAVLFGFYGLLSGNFLLLFIAFFVFMGAEAEAREVRMRAVLGALSVGQLMRGSPEPVDAQASLLSVLERLNTEQRRALPVARQGHVFGVVTLARVQQVPVDQLEQLRAHEVTQTVEPLRPESTAWDALKQLTQHALPQLPVLKDGALVGMLSHEDLQRGLEQQHEDEHPTPRGPWGVGRRESPT